MSGSDRALSRVAGLLRKAERTTNPHEAQINRSMLREFVLLHEIAHHLQPLGSPGHGRQFCQILCHLVELAIGAEAAWLLRVTLADTQADLN